MFLQGAGKSLAIPFLASLMPRETWGQSPTTIKRAVFLFQPYDYGRHQNWFPTMAQPSQQLVSTNGDRTLHYAPLSSYLTSSTSNLSLVFGNRLNSYINSINLIRGLDQSTRIAHGNGHTLGNIAATDGHDVEARKLTPIRTIDQVLRNNTRFNPINRDVVILGSGTRSYRQNTDGTISLANLVSNSPRGAFNYLFDNGNLPETGDGTTSHPRRDLLSTVLEDYNRVRNGRQISSMDRAALTNATDLISDIQKNLTGGTGGGGCRYKSIDAGGFTSGTYLPTSAEHTIYARIIAAAIMCDVSRIFSFFTFLNDNIFDVHPTEDFHQGHSHIPFSTVNGKVNWQYMGEVQYAFVRDFLQPMLAALSATDPANGQTYLYNSLVHFQIESSQVHGQNCQPCLLAGNAGGAMPSGYLLDYTDRSRSHTWVADGFSSNTSDARYAHEYVGVPMNRIFNTIFQSLGLTPAEYENSSLNTHFQGRSDNRYGSINNGITNMGGYGWWGPATSNYGEYMSRQQLYNLHHFKSVLPMPSRSA